MADVNSGSRLPLPAGSRLPQPRGAIPIPRPKATALASRAAANSVPASGRVTRRSISAPDLTKIGVSAQPGQRGKTAAQSSLLRKAITTASSRQASAVAQPTTINRKRAAPTGTAASGPDKKRPLVEANKQTDKKVPSTTAPVKRGKPAPWDIKAKLEHANEKIAKLSEENDYLSNAAAQAVSNQRELDKIREEYESLNAQLQESTANLEKVSKSEKNFKEEAEVAMKEIESLRKMRDSLKLELNQLTTKFNEVCLSEEKLKNEVEHLTTELTNLNREKLRLTVEVKECKETAVAKDQERLLQIFNEQQTRRALLNTILDLKGNIRVFCRVRPPLPDEAEKVLLPLTFPNEGTIELITTEKGMMKSQTNKKQSFSYDKVYAPQGSQSDIYEELHDLVQSALDGHNVCIFAYGQTGSGKTYTMQGGSDPESKGMIPRAIKTIYQAIQNQNKLGWQFSVQCSFLEIYNENIRDLLNPNSGLPYEVKMVESNSDVYVSNLKVLPVKSEEELLKLLEKSQKSRITAATVMNEQSSRSHSITQIKLEGFNQARDLRCQGTLNLIDLAGSEKYCSENQADRKAETVKINKSLQTLSLVVLKLASKAEHIPFRDSKLTHLLMPSLRGNSKTLMMVNIAPFEDCLNETISSLRFASRVSSVKVGSRRQVNSSIGPSPVSKPTK